MAETSLGGDPGSARPIAQNPWVVRVLVLAALVVAVLAGAYAVRSGQTAPGAPIDAGALTVTEPSTGNPLPAGLQPPTPSTSTPPTGATMPVPATAPTTTTGFNGLHHPTAGVNAAQASPGTAPVSRPAAGATTIQPLLDRRCESSIPLIGQTEIDTGRLQPRPAGQHRRIGQRLRGRSLLRRPGLTTSGSPDLARSTATGPWLSTSSPIRSDPAGWSWELASTVAPSPTPAPTRPHATVIQGDAVFAGPLTVTEPSTGNPWPEV